LSTDDIPRAASIPEPIVAPGCRNLVFGRAGDEPWAIYRVHEDRPSRLTRTGTEHPTLEALGRHVNAAFCLLRVARPWSAETYAIGVEAVADVRHVRRSVVEGYIHAQRSAVEGLKAHTTMVYLSVRLPAESCWPLDPAERERLLESERSVFQRVLECLPASRASQRELSWLVRRAFRRGLPDTPFTEPVTAASAHDSPLGAPALHRAAVSAADLPIQVRDCTLRISSELGESHQSFLSVQMLLAHDYARRPAGGGFFGLVQSLEFPVDAAITAHQLSDAGGIDHAGVDDLAANRICWSSDNGRPLLRVTVSLCVSAPSAAELERRVVRLRLVFSGIRLNRPPERQLALFQEHLPAGTRATSPAGGSFPIEQLGAIGVASPSAAGSRSGLYIGHTTSGTPRPVLFDPGELAGNGSPSATLLTGGPGSGKTICMELLMYHAFILGSVIYDIDPNGDHALERLPDVAGHVDVLELSAAKRFAGLLDPLRVGAEDAREELALDFLVGVLPRAAPLEWEIEIARALSDVVARGGRTCGEVADELQRRGVHARAAADAIRRHTASGLARLGLARHDHVAPEVGRNQVTILRARNMRVAAPGIRDAEAAPEERVGRLVMRLLAAYALKLADTCQARHCIVGIDQAAVLLADVAGRQIVDRIADRSRSGDFTPFVAAGSAGDDTGLDDRFGTVFCFRPQDEPAARAASRLLLAGADAEAYVRGLQASTGPGRCVMRDHLGRVSPVQIDFADDRLLPLLDTRPTGRAEPARLKCLGDG
jgi:hypothetical protein